MRPSGNVCILRWPLAVNISDLHKTVTFSVFSSLVCFLIGSVGTMSYVFYMILFSVFVLMLQHMTAFRFLFTQFVCTICSDSGGKDGGGWWMALTWSSSIFLQGYWLKCRSTSAAQGNWWCTCFLYLICDLMSSKSCLLLLCIFSEYIVGLVTGPLLHETAGHFFSGRLLGFTSLSLTLASAASMGNSRLDTNTRLAFGIPCYFQFLYLWSFSLLVLSHPLTVFPGLSCLNSAFVLRNFSLSPS